MRHSRRMQWLACLSVCSLAAAAVLSTRWVEYSVNFTTSLPGTLYVIRKGEAVAKGDLIAYRWHGGASYPAGSVFIKKTVGVAGDRVRRDGRAFWVNDAYVGVAKTHSRAGLPLKPAAEGVIPAGEYFVATPNPDSLDSRYALTGNVRQSEVIGRAYEVF